MALASSIWYPSLQVHIKLPKVLEQRPFLHKLSISEHSSISSKTTWKTFQISQGKQRKRNKSLKLYRTVIILGLKPDPAGHKALNSSVSGAGHNSHCGPHAFPTEQQQVDRDTISSTLLEHTFRPAGVWWTSTKQEPTRLSEI